MVNGAAPLDKGLSNVAISAPQDRTSSCRRKQLTEGWPPQRSLIFPRRTWCSQTCLKIQYIRRMTSHIPELTRQVSQQNPGGDLTQCQHTQLRSVRPDGAMFLHGGSSETGGQWLCVFPFCPPRRVNRSVKLATAGGVSQLIFSIDLVGLCNRISRDDKKCRVTPCGIKKRAPDGARSFFFEGLWLKRRALSHETKDVTFSAQRCFCAARLWRRHA